VIGYPINIGRYRFNIESGFNRLVGFLSTLAYSLESVDLIFVLYLTEHMKQGGGSGRNCVWNGVSLRVVSISIVNTISVTQTYSSAIPLFAILVSVVLFQTVPRFLPFAISS
jgi:hypothetical protein